MKKPQRTGGFCERSNLLKKTGYFIGAYLNFFQFFWTINMYQNHFFNFLRTMIMNLKITMGHLFMFLMPTQHGLIHEICFNCIYIQRINCKCGLCETSLMHLPLQCKYSKSLGMSTSGGCSCLVNILLEAINSSFLDGTWHFDACIHI